MRSITESIPFRIAEIKEEAENWLHEKQIMMEQSKDFIWLIFLISLFLPPSLSLYLDLIFCYCKKFHDVGYSFSINAFITLELSLCYDISQQKKGRASERR